MPSPKNQLDPRDVSDDWWLSVMLDPRARRRLDRDPGGQKLCWYQGKTLKVCCGRCSFREEYRADDLIARFGSDFRLLNVLAELRTCPKNPKSCQIGFADLHGDR